MIEARNKKDREEIQRRMGLERRARVSDCIRALTEQRHAVRRAADRQRLSDNALVAAWEARFHAARAV